MRGVSKYNYEGYYDPTAHEALTNVLREERKKMKRHRTRGEIAKPAETKGAKQDGK